MFSSCGAYRGARCVHRIDDDTVLLRSNCPTFFDEVYEFGAHRDEIVNASINFLDLRHSQLPDFELATRTGRAQVDQLADFTQRESKLLRVLDESDERYGGEIVLAIPGRKPTNRPK